MIGVQIFAILILLPLLAALGHDAYLYYENGMVVFKLTSVGFLWTTYSPDTFKWAVDTFDQNIWDVLNMILPQKAVYVSAVLPAVFYPVFLLLFLFGIWPFDSADRDLYGPRARAGHPPAAKRFKSGRRR